MAAGRASAATYYISSSTGSDANTAAQAQSKATPWAHLPCMANASENAKSYTPAAGDQFILKGGDSWPNASFPCTWTWSGDSSNSIYIGVDQTWFTGGSWARPVWDAGSAAISPQNIFFDLSSGQSYVMLDNIEMKNFFWSESSSYGSCVYISTYSSDHITLDHLYLHAWHHAASGASDDCFIVLGDTNSPWNRGSVLQNSVIDGTYSDSDSMTAAFAFPSAKNNIIHDMPNMLLPMGHGEISGNLLYNCTLSFSGNHANFLETLGADADGIFYIHDNVFHDSAGGCEAAFLGNTGETDYVWNNVWYNLSGNPPELTQNYAPGNAVYFWNNTIVAPPEGYCLREGNPGTYNTIFFQNNHCITTASQAVDPRLQATTLVINNNVLQTPSVANLQGYTSARIYAYSPINATVATVSEGANLTTNCTGSLSSLCSDTAYGVAYSASSGAVSGPGRTTVSRLSSSGWNVGAYQYRSPMAPTGLTVR